MRTILFIVLLVLAAPAFAQATIPCAPKSALTPAGTGTALLTESRPSGEWAAWWCQGADGAWTGVTRACVTRACPRNLARAILTAATAPDALQALDAAFSQKPADDAERFTFLGLHYRACLALNAARPDESIALGCWAPEPPK